MTDKQNPTRSSDRTIIVRLSTEAHRALRIRVAEEDTSIQKWVEALLERELGIVRQEAGVSTEEGHGGVAPRA